MLGKWRNRIPDRLRGQSEVLGVALLTAVVVILVATVALFLFTDFAQEADDEQLLATVESDVTSTSINITHQGGDSFNPDNVSVVLEGDTSAEFTLANFDKKPDTPDTFSPGDTWTKTNETFRGEFRLLVIDQESNTVLHDQQYDIKVEDVRLRIEERPAPGEDQGKFTDGPINMVGNDPSEITNTSQIRRDYLVQVRYNTGEGWKNQTGGTDNLQFDPDDPLDVVGTNDEGGVIQAGEPSADQVSVDVSVGTDTSNIAVDDNITSNTVTVTVVDANVSTITDVGPINALDGDGPDSNKLAVDWSVINDGDLNPDVSTTFTAEDQSGTTLKFKEPDASTAGNTQSCSVSGDRSSVTCDIRFKGFKDTISSTSGDLPTIIATNTEGRSGINPGTDEVTVTATPQRPLIGTKDTKSASFDPAFFKISSGPTASFNKPDAAVDTTWTVINDGSWTDRQTILADAVVNNSGGQQTDSINSGPVTLEPGQSAGQSEINAGEYEITDNKTEDAKIRVSTDNQTETSSLVDIDPANFRVTSVSAQVVRTGSPPSDKVEVSYEITNTGDLTDTQTITLLRNNSQTGDSVTRTIGYGDTVSGSLITDSFQVGGNTYKVQTDDDFRSDTINIQPPDISVTITDAEHQYDAGTQTDEVAVDYTVENDGDLTGTRDLESVFRFYDAGGTQLDTASETEGGLPLTGTDSVSRTDRAIITNYETSEIRIDVYANETSGAVADSDSRTVTVAPGNLEVSIDDSEANPNGNGKLVVNYTLENTGDLFRETDVALNITDDSGNRIRTVNVTGDETQLSGGESLSPSLSGTMQEGDVGPDGDVDFRVNATDDAQSSSEVTGDTGADPPEIVFDGVNFNQNGELLEVTGYGVENTGDVPAKNTDITYTAQRKSISLLNTGVLGTSGIKDDIVDALNNFEAVDTVSLDPGESETKSGFRAVGNQALNVTKVLDGLLGSFTTLEIEANVSSPDDFETYDWTVEPPTYEPSITSSSFDDDKQEVTIGWEVENTGNFADGEKDIRFIVNGQQEKLIEKEISPNTPETGTETFSVSGPSPLSEDGDIINVTVATEDDNATTAPGEVSVTPNEFTIQPSTSFNFDPAAPGEDAEAEVSYTIKNTGDFAGTQDIRFRVNGNVVDTNGGVTLQPVGPDSTVSGSLSEVVTQADLDNSDQIPVSLKTDNDTEPFTLNPKPSYFRVDTISASYDPGSEEARVTNWEVTNTGEFTREQNIEFLVNGNQKDSVSREIAPGETQSGSFSAGVTESVLDGSNEFTVTVRTANDTDGETKTLSAQPPNFDLSNVDFTFDAANVNDDAQVFVDYDLENTGEFTDTQTVELVVGDGGSPRVPASQQYTLGPTSPPQTGQSLSATVTAADLDGGVIPLTLRTDDDSESGSVNPDAPNFDIREAQSSVSFNDGTASGTYRIVNTGDFEVTRDIEFEVDTTVRDTDTTTLAPGQPATGTFSVSANDPGQNNYDLVVAIDSQDDQISQSFTVDTANFDVKNVNAGYDAANQEADVNYDIKNTGDFPATQTVTTKATNDGTTSNDDVTVQPGQTVSRQSSVGISSTGSQTIRVSSDDDSDTGSIFVNGPDFQVTSVTATYDRNNEDALVDFTVENTGDLAGTKDVSISTDPGGNGGSKTFTNQNLAPNGQFTQTDVRININSAGTTDLVVSTPDDNDGGPDDRDSINIDGPNIVVTNVNAPGSTGTGSFTYDYTIENQGDLTGTDYLYEYQDGTYTGYLGSYTLAPGESQTPSDSISVSRSDAPSTTVEVGGASDTVTVNVDPLFSSTAVTNDGSSVSCSFFGVWGACAGNWDHTLKFDAEWTLDDPSNTADKVEAYINPGDEAGDETQTDSFWSGNSGKFDYSDSWSDPVGGRNCNVNVDVEFRVYRNGQRTDTVDNNNNGIDMGC